MVIKISPCWAREATEIYFSPPSTGSTRIGCRRCRTPCTVIWICFYLSSLSKAHRAEGCKEPDIGSRLWQSSTGQSATIVAVIAIFTNWLDRVSHWDMSGIPIRCMLERGDVKGQSCFRQRSKNRYCHHDLQSVMIVQQMAIFTNFRAIASQIVKLSRLARNQHDSLVFNYNWV